MGIFSRSLAAGSKLGARVAAKVDSAGASAAKTGKDVVPQYGPSPNPATNVLLADLALRGGGQLLRRAVERGVLGKAYTPEKAKNLIKGRSMTQTLIGTAIARIATRSVPGALIVGGGMLAKTLYDRKRSQEAKREGAEAIEDQAERGKS